MTAPYLFNPPPSGPLPAPNPSADPIGDLLASLFAHKLPASTTTAPPVRQAHLLPAMTTTAPAPPMAHMLPAVQATAPSPPASGPSSAIQGLLATLTNTTPPDTGLTPSTPPGGLLANIQAPNVPGGPGGQSAPGMPGADAGPMQAGGPGPMAPTAPMPSMAPMPPGAPSPDATASPNMLHRIAHSLASIPHDVSSALTGGPAGGYDGLLTDKEQETGKSSPFWWLLGPAGAMLGHEVATQRMNDLVKMHSIATQVGEHARVMDARRQMASLFPLPENPSIDDIRTNLAKQYSFALSHGDEETLKDVGSRLSSIFAAPKPEVNKVLGPGSALVGPHGEVLAKTDPMDKQFEPKPFLAKDGSTIWVKPGDPVPSGAKSLTQGTTEIRVEAQNARAAAAETRAEQARTDKAVKDYTAQIKPLRERAAVIDQALKTLDDAAHNPNPAVRKTLYTSAVANFIQAADQKAQIRYQLLNYFKQNVDPSIAGKWEVLKSRLLNGTLPGYSMEGMIGHLKNLRTLSQGEIEQQRNGLIQRRPELEDALPKTSEFFAPEETTSTGGGSTAAGGNSGGAPRRITVNGKTFTVPH